MADENDKLLTDEELNAIEEMVASGDFGGDGYNVGVAASTYDLTLQDTSVGVNVTAIEQINDRFHRFMRAGLLDELRYNARLQPGRIEIIRYGDYVQSTSPPLSVNVTKIDPLRGECLAVIHSQVVFSCLDNWFGGSPQSLTSVAPGRIFTPTESAVIEKIRGVIFQSLSEAWAPFLQVDCSLATSEISAVFANIAADDDMIILNRFETMGDGEDLGYVDIVYPYASLKLVRDVLRSRIQTSGSDDEADMQWGDDLVESLDEVPIDVVVTAAELEISVEQLSSLKAGDWLPIRPPEHAEVSVNGFPVFTAEVGSKGNQVAIQIVESVMPEEDS
ncbi:MAG: FliM/FliN family flagellar motor switch protein [Pseudomonadales bacterium]|jgi:flagellar motor switch protein FliM|nr:FliM/FliN family flagellar motor switch protein [Pseudomonadales bacterium]